MQRAQRNLPLYQSEEKRRAEREQGRVLMLREHQKDLQYFQKEEMDRRCSEIPQRFDMRAVFGLMDSNPAALAEQRWRAQNISEELMNTANNRRRGALEKCFNGKKTEREIMQRDHKQMLEERIRRYENLRLLRSACEENWKHSAEIKQQRDQEELNIRRYRNKLMIP